MLVIGTNPAITSSATLFLGLIVNMLLISVRHQDPGKFS